ncbi:CAP domain-containing protein [Deinococcus frigens]|uniref:CAP domain-containing protein n=1 Tax=Deinococcus frigens TaxID=249403 RepID=UPI0004986014|nr:CAP domain-containing protein [Deinococcus frigens]
MTPNTTNITLSAALMSAALLLSGCGVTPPTGSETSTPTPTPKPTPTPASAVLFIPAAGAAVGTGDGTKTGTVYVTPSAEEVQLMKFVNEVRTTGKISGADATAGSCVAGKFTPLKPLTFNGLFAYAARKHATYLSEVGYEAHTESQTASPFFYGATVVDRLVRAYKEEGTMSMNINAYGYGANAAANLPTPEAALRAWMQSPGHCANLMRPEHTMMGLGVHDSPVDFANNRYGKSWDLMVGWKAY